MRTDATVRVSIENAANQDQLVDGVSGAAGLPLLREDSGLSLGQPVFHETGRSGTSGWPG